MASTAVSLDQQRSIVRELAASDANNIDAVPEGEEWFVISNTWYNQWKSAVDYTECGMSSGKEPGAIDNSDIVEEQRLKNPAGEGSDFAVIPPAIWNQLVAWYGLVDGSPVIWRPIVGSGPTRCVELSAPVFDLFVADADTGPEGKSAGPGSSIVASKTSSLASLRDRCIEHLGQNAGDEDNVRLWFRLDQDDCEWELIPTDDAAASVGTLQQGDLGIARARAPALLIEVREPMAADWVRSTDDAAAATAADGVQIDAVRKRADSMDETSWRSSLDVGHPLDVYDGKRWRESAVAATDAEKLVIRFRNTPEHRLETTRGAGSARTPGAVAQLGDIAKPYTHVSDWRSQLRRDMMIEMLQEETQHHYYCSENETYLHFVQSHNEWWVSDYAEFKSHKRHGYINVVGVPEQPPPSKKKLWEIYVGARIWKDTDKVTVTIPEVEKGEAEKIVLQAAEGIKESYGAHCTINPAKVTGVYERQDGSWTKTSVKKIDYKKRLISVAAGGRWSTTGVGYTYSRVWVPKLVEMSLDSDSIREVLFKTNGGEDDEDIDALGPEQRSGRVNHKLVGLRNLGNTCFMNSILQCLFACAPLMDFFVDATLVDSEINTKNPLGTGGKLAKAFSNLVREIARSKPNAVVVPTHFKQTLGNFCARFAGFQQQDAMEFFNSLTSDLLHEDVNRIQKKPYVESVESGDDPDAVVAKEAWRRHKLRNDSVIVDLFFGQFKSHLTCPNASCEGKSWRKFDPFVAVPCPLPPAPKVRAGVQVRVYKLAALTNAPTPAAAGTTPNMFTVETQCELVGAAVAEEIAKASDLEISNLLIVEIWGDKVHRCVFDPVSGINNTFLRADILVAFELPKGFDPKTHRMVEARFLFGKRNTVLLFPVAKDATNRQLRDQVWNLFQHRVETDIAKIEGVDNPLFLTGDKVKTPAGTEGTIISFTYRQKKRHAVVQTAEGLSIDVSVDDLAHATNFVNNAKEHLAQGEAAGRPYVLQYQVADVPFSSAYKTSSVVRKPKYGIFPVPNSPEKDGDTIPHDLAMVELSWKRPLLYLQKTAFDESFEKPPVYNKNHVPTPEEEDEGPQVLNLSNCLKQFATREQLGQMDTWYCPSCKEHVQAFKKMDLWKLPELLCFHLKRFSYEVGQFMTHRDKLEEFVDFPLEIDMLPYLPEAAVIQAHEEAQQTSNGKSDTADAPELSMRYELVGVSNHMGNLGFGHYTAYTKRGSRWYLCDDSSVREVKPDSVRTAKAYVLFYRRITPASQAQNDAADAAIAAREQPADVPDSELETKASSPKLGALPPPPTGDVEFPDLDDVE